MELNHDEVPLAFQTKWTDLHTYRFELKNKVDTYIVVSDFKFMINVMKSESNQVETNFKTFIKVETPHRNGTIPFCFSYIFLSREHLFCSNNKTICSVPFLSAGNFPEWVSTL